MDLKIVFRVDASKQIGTGHLIRCVTLAKELERIGARCSFLCKEHEDNLFDYVLENRFELKILKKQKNSYFDMKSKDDLNHSDWLGSSQVDDAQQSIQLMQTSDPDWLIIDHYGIDYRWQELLRPHCKKILVIDDLADRKHTCDLLLDQNFVNNYLNRYDNLVKPTTAKLLGPKFALLQKDYSDFKNKVPKINNNVENILVYFGGSDLHGLTESVVDALVEILENTVNVDIVVNQPSKSLLNKIHRKKNFNFYSNLTTLAPLISKADLAIGAGGTTTWERCFMGTPSIVITTAENQIATAKKMHEQKMIHWIGHFYEINKVDLPKEIKDILLDFKFFSASSKKCSKLVDGRGAERVVQIMLLKESSDLVARFAKIEDEKFLLELRNDPDVRANSFSTKLIDSENHKLWLREILEHPAMHELFIIETSEGLPIGQVRFDKKFEKWEISYSILSYARRKNLGTRIIALAIRQFLINKSRIKLHAKTKESNMASRKILEKNLFTIKSHEADFLIYEYKNIFDGRLN